MLRRPKARHRPARIFRCRCRRRRRRTSSPTLHRPPSRHQSPCNPGRRRSLTSSQARKFKQPSQEAATIFASEISTTNTSRQQGPVEKTWIFARPDQFGDLTGETGECGSDSGLRKQPIVFGRSEEVRRKWRRESVHSSGGRGRGQQRLPMPRTASIL